jgi:epoxide hydrolase
MDAMRMARAMTFALFSRRQFLGSSTAAALALVTQKALGALDPGVVSPFTYHASDSALADLKRRLDTTRWPDKETIAGWEEGPPLAAMRSLIEYWRGPYDWRNAEAALNQWPQFKTTIDGLGIHFIYVRARHSNARPLLLTHGWPSSILLFRDVIEPLTNPTAHGGTEADAFDVVIPSLPGFGFSDKPTESGWNAARTARAWEALMRRLGYRRWFAQGGDWGAFVTTALAQQRAAGLVGIHLNFAQTIPDVIPAKLSKDQRKAVAALTEFQEKEFGYGMLQSTKPQLAGYLLSDSPLAQAAWLYDIFDAGTGRTGDPDSILGRDNILDEMTLFWLTDSGASSARFYLEQATILGKRNNPGRVEIPVGVTVFPKDLPAVKSWARDVYPQLAYWHEVDRGGHFAQLEVPALFVDELRRAFRSIDSL